MNYSIHQHLNYSVRANSRMVETLMPVDEKLIYAEAKSSFSSIAKTLLHVWDAEVIWMKRMQGESLTSWPSANFHGNKNELLSGFLQSSKDLAIFINSRDDAFVKGTIAYRNLKGDSFENVVEHLLYHIVNHGTYHRGQIITLLRGSGITNLLSEDIIIYLRTLN